MHYEEQKNTTINYEDTIVFFTQKVTYNLTEILIWTRPVAKKRKSSLVIENFKKESNQYDNVLN